MSLLDNSFNSEVSRPCDRLQKVARLCLLDLGDIRILVRRFRLVEVCEQSKQEYRFKSVSLGIRAKDNLR